MPVVAEPRDGRRLLTSEELSRTAAAGLPPGERSEFLDDEIRVVVTEDPPHAGVVAGLTRPPTTARGEPAIVRAERPVEVPGRGAPLYGLVDLPRRRVVVREGARPDGSWSPIRETDVVDLPGRDASPPASEPPPPDDRTRG